VLQTAALIYRLQTGLHCSAGEPREAKSKLFQGIENAAAKLVDVSVRFAKSPSSHKNSAETVAEDGRSLLH